MEEGFKIVVWVVDEPHVMTVVNDQTRQFCVHASEVIGLDEKFMVVGKTDAEHSGMAQDVLCKGPCIIANDSDGVGNLVEAFANCMKVAEGNQFSLVKDTICSVMRSISLKI